MVRKVGLHRLPKEIELPKDMEINKSSQEINKSSQEINKMSTGWYDRSERCIIRTR